MKNKLIALLIVLLLISSPVSAFSDMNESQRYYDNVRYLYEHKVISGYSDGEIKADAIMTRAEFAAVVCRLLNIEKEAENKNGTTVFHDVSSDNWASGYINTVTQRKLMESRAEGFFRPEDAVTNWQALKAIVDMTLHLEPMYKHPLIYPERYLETAEEVGIYNPSKSEVNLTRGQVAYMIFTALDLPLKSSYGGRSIGTLKENIQPSYKFRDEGIEYLCTYELGKEAADIKSADLRKIKELNAFNLPEGVLIKKLDDIENMPNLQVLTITNQQVEDISPLSRIKGNDGEFIREFQEIDLYNNPIRDISPLKEINVKNIVSFPYYKNDNPKRLITFEEYAEMMDIVYSVTDKHDSLGDKLKAAHDYLVLNTKYVLNATESIRTPYGTIVRGEAVCEGYAEAFKLFCDAIEVECWLVEGSAGSGEDWGQHEWNKIELDGKAYYVDVTWDDYDYADFISYDYFLKEDISLDHKEFNVVEDNFDRFEYSLGKGKNNMTVDITFSTPEKYDRVKISFDGGKTCRDMVCRENSKVWTYSYNENPEEYFDVNILRNKDVSSPDVSGESVCYNGEYRKKVAIEKYIGAGWDFEEYEIIYNSN